MSEELAGNRPKRGQVVGFDGIRGKETSTRLKNWTKKQPAGKWRAWTQIRIKYVIICRKWEWNDKQYTEKHISPLGMVKYITNLLLNEKCTYSLPKIAKEELTKDSNLEFKAKDVKVSCSDNGEEGYGTFYVLYCKECSKNKLPTFTDRHKKYLPENSKMEDIMSHWDDLLAHEPSIKECADYCGCILPNSPDIIAGPNNRRFILRPADHFASHHKVEAAASVPKKRPSTDPAPTTFTKKASNTLVEKSGTLSTYQQCTTASTSGVKVTIRGNLKYKHKDIASMIDPKLTLSKEARDDIDAWAQNYALSVVLSGTNKYPSQAAIVHLYDTAVEGVKGYHNILLGKVEIDGKKILPPPKVALNEHNVSTFQGSILAAYKEIGTTGVNKSPFQEMKKEFGKYYSIFNDGIQKFSMELNGVMVRTVDENFEVVNIPWSLSKIPGGSMNHEKLCHQIVSVIDTIIKFSKFNTDAMDAESKFLKEFDFNFPGEIPPVLPSLFKCCVLDHLDFDKKELNLVFEHWPLANVGDGCSVNKKAGEKLTADIGLLTPTTRCSGHAATGTIKRLTTSKTMCVEEMVVFAEGLKPILRHFKLSGKGTESLNNALQLLEMKPLRLMTWCPTRMCNLLDCSKRTVEILFPLCDTLTSCDIKKEEAAYFLSPLCLGILHLMADLEVKFLGSFLRQLDTDAAILIDVFGLSEKMIATLDCLETPLYDEFLSGLHEDGYGNIRYEKVDTSGNKQTITLQYSHRPSRNSANSKVDVIKNECMAVKEKVIDNMKDNIEDQSQSNTIVEYASAFDMARKIDKETRIKHIKQLFEIYAKEYIHNIEHCEGLADYTVTMKYLPKLKCTENEIIGEFNSMWSILNKAWLKYKDSNPKNTRTKRFWNYILEQYSVQYSNIAVLILILFAISPGTGPLERSYSKLAKICYKDRCRLKAENLEVLYLLATLAIKEKDDELFKKARDFLQS